MSAHYLLHLFFVWKSVGTKRFIISCDRSYHIYKIHIGLGKQTVIIKNCPDLRKALSIYAAKTNSVCIFASGNGTNIDMNNYLDISQLVLS